MNPGLKQLDRTELPSSPGYRGKTPLVGGLYKHGLCLLHSRRARDLSFYSTVLSPSNTDIMSVFALLCVTLFCALVKTEQSQHGYCDEGGCWIGYRESVDYQRGARRCKILGGLMIPITAGFENVPFGSKSDTGFDWRLMVHRVNGTKACVTISKTPPGNASISAKDCGEKLEGVVCYLEIQDPCRHLQVNKDLPVKYTGYMGFVLENAKALPGGTVALRGKDGEHPESKYVCFSGKWLKAPWTCGIQEGGCGHSCKEKNQTVTCLCPAGKSLHPNKYTCVDDPCSGCAHNRSSHVYACEPGFRLEQDGKSCVDVDECAENGELCKNEGERCWNTYGGYVCSCRDGFDTDAGVCVNKSICLQCEHMKCKKRNGVYACECRKGYKVSPTNPVKCVRDCGESCEAECDHNSDKDCLCPEGYLKHVDNNVTLCRVISECDMGTCDQLCENKPGGFRCFCKEGFELHGKDTCKPIPKKKESEKKKEDEGKKVEGADKLGPHPSSTWVASQESSLPQYIRTGSILGISVFLVLCLVCVSFMGWRLFQRCSSFSLPSLSSQDIDVFYLQQVTTETYKRLSFDKESKTDSQ